MQQNGLKENILDLLPAQLETVITGMGEKKFRATQVFGWLAKGVTDFDDMKNVPGVDISTGSLGLGVSTACGMALSGKISNDSYRVYAVLGDGECEEGCNAFHAQLDGKVTLIY